jgi:hypothetical protein
MFRAALLAIVVLGFFNTVAAQTPKSDQLKTEVPPQGAGRYQIVMSPHAARYTFLLDTETGRVWQLTAFTFLNGDPSVWDLMPRIDNFEDYEKVVHDRGRKPTSPPPKRGQ